MGLFLKNELVVLFEPKRNNLCELHVGESDGVEESLVNRENTYFWLL